MRICIRYLRKGEVNPAEIELAPDDYFDPLDPGESLSVRCVPKFLDTHEYTPYSPDELAWTVVEITDAAEFWKIRTQLLDGMRTLMHHTESSDGSEEIIHSTEISPRCWHTIRTLKMPGELWSVVMNNLTVECPAVATADRNYCERWRYEELRAFGEVK